MKSIYNRKYGIVYLVVAVVAIYFPILGNDFLYYWDDQWQVLNRYTEGCVYSVLN